MHTHTSVGSVCRARTTWHNKSRHTMYQHDMEWCMKSASRKFRMRKLIKNEREKMHNETKNGFGVRKAFVASAKN